MEITIEIVDRNYEQIKEFCDFNNIKIEDYIVQCAEDDFFTRKYGDLNEKMNKENKEEISKEDVIKTEKKKVGRPKKKIEETAIIEKEKPIEEPKVNTEQFFVRNEDTIDTTNKELQKQQVRIKRTLKTR